MITVLLCDDQALIRGGLRMILSTQTDIDIVGEAIDGTEAVTMVIRDKPDVVLMDIRMPGLDGIEATRRISAEPGVHTRILILTTFNEDEYLIEALRAGAAGFLLKSCPPDELIHAIRRTDAGETSLAPEITRQLLDNYLQQTKLAERQSRLAALTERELDVLTLIGTGQTNREIATTLFVGDATVKTHINRIFAKLGLRDRTQAVIAAYENGLVRPGETRPT